MKKLHIICGMCGCDTELSFQIDGEANDIDGVLTPGVIIICENCGELTGLEEHIPQLPSKNLTHNQ